MNVSEGSYRKARRVRSGVLAKYAASGFKVFWWVARRVCSSGSDLNQAFSGVLCGELMPSVQQEQPGRIV